MGSGDKPTAISLTRVLILESTKIACELLAHILESSRYGLKVTGMATNAEMLAPQAVAEADVVIISSTLETGPVAGFTALRQLRKHNNSIRCLMLLERPEREFVIEAFRSGALGVYDCTQSYELLCKGVHSIHQGQVWATSQQLTYVLDALVSRTPIRVTDAKGKVLLTRREEEIASLVADGLKNREVADALELSDHTVKNYLFRIYEKLGISTRTELILYLIGNRGSSDKEAGPEPSMTRVQLIK